jgi:DNA-binding transcriptional MerR regulator
VSTRTYLSIGDVLTLLRQEFSDITISKIRFLESQGLVNPERSPSGYRKFYEHDVERLRWVLRQQREHFLPLKVIRDRLARDGELPDEVTDLDGDVDGDFEGDVDHGTDHADGAVYLEELNGTESSDDAAFAHPVEPTAPDVFAAPPGALNGSSYEAEPVEERTEPRAGALVTASSPLAPRVSTVKTAQVARREAEGRQRNEPPVRGAKAAPEPRPVRAAPAATAASAPEPAAPRAPRPAGREPGGVVDGAAAANVSGASLTLDELCAASGLAATEVASLEGFGLIEPLVLGGELYYDEEALTVAKLAADFARYGIEPRHLRLFRNAVDRELGLIEQVVTPLLRQRNPEARQRAVDAAGELSRLGQSLRAAILRRALHHHLGG